MKEAFDIALAGVCLSGLAATGAALLVNAAWVSLAKRARAASGRSPARRVAFLAAPVALAFGMILYGGSKGLLLDGARTVDSPSSVLARTSESGMASSSVVQADETALSVEASPVLAAAPTNAPTAAPAGAVTDEDIARGWRLVSAATNALASFSMPPDGAVCGTWHLCGAYEDVQVVDFGDWRFPIGTGETPKVWAFVWGRLRPALRDSLREIRTVDAPMSAIPSVSRLWTAATADGGRLVTWERFALGRIPRGEPLTAERTVNAQVELFPNGGFVTRSNEIERVYARIEPFDWDGDGWHNDDDPDPKAWTGGGFGLVQTLPPEANESAYYWIDIVADFNAPVVFAGDGFSDLADPSFTARAGETNRVTLLVGKSYAVTAARPVRVVGCSSRQVRVEGDGTVSLTVRFPVSFRADPAKGGGFAMVVEPSGLGGSFSWTGACCPLTGSGDSFWFACSGGCPCGGCEAAGIYDYEGYALRCEGGGCGCPRGDERYVTRIDDAPCAASASVSFSKPTVLFENAYTNRPGDAAGRRSTRTTLSCVAHGGERGVTASFSLIGGDRLVCVRGGGLPVSRFVPPQQRLEFEIDYEGRVASEEQDDIVARAEIDVDSSSAASSTASLTSVEVELRVVYDAPENGSKTRHLYGVGELVELRHCPQDADVKWEIGESDCHSMLLDGADCDNLLKLHYRNERPVALRARRGAVVHAPQITLVEPQEVVCRAVEWDGTCLPEGQAGGVGMRQELFVGPMHVSFRGIDMAEIPCESILPPTGYYATTNFSGALSHTAAAGAGFWHHIGEGNRWCVDHVASAVRPQPWSDGEMTWKIPIQWFERLESSLSWPDGMVFSDGKFVGGSEVAHLQVFNMTECGTARVSKHGHWISRTTNDVIRLDGRVVHEGGH